jgi:hypothetical protein
MSPQTSIARVCAMRARDGCWSFCASFCAPVVFKPEPELVKMDTFPLYLCCECPFKFRRQSTSLDLPKQRKLLMRFIKDESEQRDLDTSIEDLLQGKSDHDCGSYGWLFSTIRTRIKEQGGALARATARGRPEDLVMDLNDAQFAHRSISGAERWNPTPANSQSTSQP